MINEGGGMATTRAERAESTRRTILDAAIELFLAKPYDEVSVHELASAAGVSYGLVAHHFGNKRGIHREAMRQIARQLEQGPPPPGPAGERIRRLLGDHLTAARNNPPAYLGLMLAPDAETSAVVESGKQIAVHAVADILGLDADRPATRLVLWSWVNAASEATVAWLQDGAEIPIVDLTEWLASSLAAMLRGAAHLDAGLESHPAVVALDPTRSS